MGITITIITEKSIHNIEIRKVNALNPTRKIRKMQRERDKETA